MYRGIDSNHNNRVSIDEIWRKMEMFNLTKDSDQKLVFDHAQAYMITTPGNMTYNEFAAFFAGNPPPDVNRDSWRVPQHRREFVGALEKIRTSNENRILINMQSKFETNVCFET